MNGKLYAYDVLIAGLLMYFWNDINSILERDTTNLSLIILGLTVVGLVFLPVTHKETPVATLWFLSDVVISLGMMGTVLGLIFASEQGFSDLGGSLENTKAVLDNFRNGFGVALSTTFLGVLGSILLKTGLVLGKHHL